MAPGMEQVNRVAVSVTAVGALRLFHAGCCLLFVSSYLATIGATPCSSKSSRERYPWCLPLRG